ncbi:MAG: proline--tRNA ligase [Gammaproteobacteria bacterium]|nr:proline--tRNA ligase [Gammaproteobacteria bacterium]
MRRSNFPINTLKEVPADAETRSHQLMLRAGLIRRLASGLYTWLPLGMRVLQNVQTIIREEMNKAKALELTMPVVQPAELWAESGRWEQYGPELLRLKDRHKRDFCLGPTHEEVITDIARHELKSYRQLPVNYYQIQTKFRDEIRPRFGVMRAREFIMKDAYSFHMDESSLIEGYQVMRETYAQIFTRLQLDFRIVQADPGAIGGNQSEEFHVLAESGEDAIAYSEKDNYSANIEAVSLASTDGPLKTPTKNLEMMETPQVRTIKELCNYLKVTPDQCLKTLLVEGTESPAVALVLRGDHELNSIKAQTLKTVASPLRMLRPSEVEESVGVEPGFLGPKDLEVPIYIDNSAATMSDFVCGANTSNYHYVGANWNRDFPLSNISDLRNAVTGDPSPSGGSPLSITRGIEVGHIFQLGNKYSSAMNATVLDTKGLPRIMHMGCYGIGVTRVIAASIEQNNDANGIIWPNAIAPFNVTIIPINMDKSCRVKEATDELYDKLKKSGFETLIDDRQQRPGVKFADADLLGIPHRLVVAEKALDRNEIEYKSRISKDTEMISFEKIIEAIKEKTKS